VIPTDVTVPSAVQLKLGEHFHDSSSPRLLDDEIQAGAFKTIEKSSDPIECGTRIAEVDSMKGSVTVVSSSVQCPLNDCKANELNGKVRAIIGEDSHVYKDDTIVERVNDLKIQAESSDWSKGDQSLLIEQSSEGGCVSVADWITGRTVGLNVSFTPRAEEQLLRFCSNCSSADDAVDARFRLRHMDGADEVRRAIVAILGADPRSVYRRKHCADRLYYFSVDSVKVTCWFDEQTAEVLDLRPSAECRDAV